MLWLQNKNCYVVTVWSWRSLLGLACTSSVQSTEDGDVFVELKGIGCVCPGMWCLNSTGLDDRGRITAKEEATCPKIYHFPASGSLCFFIFVNVSVLPVRSLQWWAGGIILTLTNSRVTGALFIVCLQPEKWLKWDTVSEVNMKSEMWNREYQGADRRNEEGYTQTDGRIMYFWLKIPKDTLLFGYVTTSIPKLFSHLLSCLWFLLFLSQLVHLSPLSSYPHLPVFCFWC